MVALIGRKIPTTGAMGAQASGLGDVFGQIANVLSDPLTPAIKREKLMEINRQNISTQALMEAARSGALADRNAIAASIGMGADPKFLSGYNLYDVSNRRGPESPEYSAAYMGIPGSDWVNTPQGRRENTAAQEATKIAVEGARPYQAIGPEGPYTLTQAEATRDRVRPVLPLTQEQGAYAANVTQRPGGLNATTPVEQKFVGIAQPKAQLQSLWDPNTRQVYQSQDGGQTIQIGNVQVPTAGMGLQPISNEQAVAQTQDTMTRQNLRALPPQPTMPSRAALAAETTSGPLAPVKHEFNTLAGLIGAGEAFPQTNEARNYLTNLVNTTRNVLTAAPGRVSVQAQQWAAEPFPQPGWFGMTGINAEEQKNNVSRTVAHLREVYESVRQESLDPNLPPAERQKNASYLHNLANVIKMWEGPPPEPTQTAEPAPSAPTAPITGGAQAAPTQSERWERVNGVLQRVQ